MRGCIINPRGGAAQVPLPPGRLRPAWSAAHPSRRLGLAWVRVGGAAVAGCGQDPSRMGARAAL